MGSLLCSFETGALFVRLAQILSTPTVLHGLVRSAYRVLSGVALPSTSEGVFTTTRVFMRQK